MSYSYSAFTSNNSQQTLNQVMADVESMPQFLGDAVQWGIDASFYAVGFMALLALGISMFKR